MYKLAQGLQAAFYSATFRAFKISKGFLMILDRFRSWTQP